MLLATLALVASSLAAQVPLPRLHAGGSRWIDETGNRVVLNGCNLGNWLIQEMWMHNMGVPGIPDQFTLEQTLTSRFGASAADAVLDLYRDNYITARDFKIIRSFGMNAVRLPFVYTLLTDEQPTFQLKSNAWVYLDRAIDMAEAEGIYTILDLHGAPGRQSTEQHTGRQNVNQLFSIAQHQQAAKWLWREIASRYKNRSAVAAYDLLNEPWGSTRDAMKNLALDLYAEVRTVDPDHVVLLPGYWDGFDFYPDPRSRGMTDVGLTMHFYPGIFDGRPATVATHSAWLGTEVYAWQDRAAAYDVPFLVGEMNVVYKGAGGGEMMRHAFDAHASFGWATTMWSYKVFSAQGGAGDWMWGMVTNPPGDGAPRIKADTWTCDGFDSAFSDGCVARAASYIAPGSGPVRVYLTIKAGACCGGALNVVVDEVGLRRDSTRQEMVTNGGFGSSAGWTQWLHSGSLSRDYAWMGAGPADGSPPGLRLSGSDFVNGGVYQALTLEGGETYTLRGAFRDTGSNPNAVWVEVFLRADAPVQGQDYVPGPVAGSNMDVTTSSRTEIESYFRSLSSMAYFVDEDLKHWMTTDEAPNLFAPPIRKLWYGWGSADGWQTPGTEMTETPNGSRIHRRRLNFASAPSPEHWKPSKTDFSEEYPGGNGVDAWVKLASAGPIDLIFNQNSLGDGWLPDANFMYQEPIYRASAYVAVGSFQSQIGDTNWNTQSTITLMSDNGATKGDLVAGDLIYTLEVTIPAQGSYLFTGVLVDRSWQTRITGISATGDTSRGEFTFQTTAPDQKVRFLCDAVFNRVSLEIGAIPTLAPPSFTQKPIAGPDATRGVPYSGSITGSAADPNGERLAYAKLSGPAWLSITTDGVLSGTPGAQDLGNNSWTVRVHDGSRQTDLAALRIIVKDPAPASSRFLRADSNADGVVDISDAIRTLRVLYSGAATTCRDSLDSNDDGALNVSDAIHTLQYIFRSGPAPPAPGPASCGADPTPDALDCTSHGACP